MKDDFEFRLDVKKTRVTEKEILDSLRIFAARRDNRAFTQADYDSWRDKVCTSGVISGRLGSWRRALARVGIQNGGRGRYSTRELMDNLEMVWREIGRPPGKVMIARKGLRISEPTYRRRWGSLKEACQLLARFKRGEITEQQLLGTVPSRQTQAAQTRAALSLRRRWDVLKRDNYKCVKCGAGPPDAQLEVDHIVPVSRGGTNDLGNLRTLCRSCNQGKKDQ